ncbi:2-dehydro-3-deoxyphosphooctonate aldolase (KDO 8-P synthase) [Saprolegnia diclina VS20]|uniref:3-deoxy-8-phosphooctulonate synthase n=1 Tax=Saprolegnia diclina (strain VS20) TaxID=1156394 RepID=T0Q2I0_SAPDV|nr:2-dehydro-3-deoxyphosphooctonate aldolase (KDO 8-P synthase) [Saprolegnia diclina VS20]EQC28771.1 2-dehydro-3-deoxyphosphooctonate aldolase (KDO 8-P synthase) [Saprolegnia diclina VS20]|eukprot:XP_008617766.1 2-dehydro-3-deoxyphosphooctonate aldolase (KDO 8-P synthase) [Saprolegnia diclina VS20]
MLAATLRRASPFFLVAGPCVIESKDVVLEIAHSLKAIGDELQIPVVFKASFDKANRQDIASFRGPGLEQGLAILEAVKAETGLPLLTDVHETYQVQAVGDVVDIVQIPAYLCRQTDLLVAAARTGKLVNIKKGQMCSADTMLLAAKKVTTTTGHADVILTDRGTMFGYGDLVVDPRNIPKLRANGALVVQDITHSVQRTGASTTSGGDREFIATIARMAAAVGVDGLFIETHPDPSRGLSDATTMLPLHELRPLLTELIAIAHASKARASS